MFQYLKSILATALAAAVAVQAYSEPGACSGYCWAHDPAVIQRASDGTYFKFNTGTGIQYATASSLAGPWTIQGFVLPNGSSINNFGSKDPWAPDVHLVNGVYYLYYAVSTFGSQNSAIDVATSTTMNPGTWTDHGSTGVSSSSSNSYNAIDPNLIIVGSTPYLNFGSFWDDIFQVKMSSSLTSTAGSSLYNIEYDSAGTRPCEGSYMFYYGGYYYLLWSHGICCGYQTTLPASGDEYMIMMARSKSATGGFVNKNGVPATNSGGSILLKSHDYVYGPGGQGVFTSSTHGLVLYYHYADKNVGLADADYLFGWNVLSWSNGWPVV
ncbi:glycoside hydrolase family 43 protein [Hyaloscypha hepaticicola]|uniref:Arabinan endo-1,5-alpha-L-arabinosidase n=1 Tax=Hyaloscypha hepaticicola TaxID=2082293 RepID=A0A2J6PSM0_9HELO|nr:glycoside hydrolase family 43 protein [Hyaloscypha hepaticicola]